MTLFTLAYIVVVRFQSSKAVAVDRSIYFPVVLYHKNEGPPRRTSLRGGVWWAIRGWLGRSYEPGAARRCAPSVQGLVPRTQGSKRLLLAAEDAAVAAPAVAVEPAPVLDPAVAVPVEARDELGAAGVPPVREDEVHLAAERLRDVRLVLQDVLAVLFAEVGRHLLRPGDHRVADHLLLVSLEEAEEVVGAAADGHRGRDGVLDLPGVARVDQCPEPLDAELFLQVCQAAVIAHDPCSCPFIQRAYSSPTRQRGKPPCLWPSLCLLI